MPGTVTVPSTLKGEAANMWRSTFLSAYDVTCAKRTDRDACAASIAWAQVKKSYKKGKGGQWVSKAGDPAMGPVSPVPDVGSPALMGGDFGIKAPGGLKGTSAQRWKMTFAFALANECRNSDHPVECARAKANAAVGVVEEKSMLLRGGAGSGHHSHAGRPGEVGGSKPGQDRGSGKRALSNLFNPRDGGKNLSNANKADIRNTIDFLKTLPLKELRKLQDKARASTGGSEERIEHFQILDRVLASAVDEKVFGNKSVAETRVFMDSLKDYPLEYIERREFTAEKRREMAKKGHAMKDGSFPIGNCEDVANALRSLGRTDKPRKKVIAHIKRRASSLGCKMTPALQKKMVAVDRYVSRSEQRAMANTVDISLIERLGDQPIVRPDRFPSDVWNRLPPSAKTVRAEATRRIIERNYAQAVEDAQWTGWKVSLNHYAPEEYIFSRRVKVDEGELLIRSILVRTGDSLEWELRKMSDFASGTIAAALPAGVIRHVRDHGLKIPYIEG